MNDACFVSWRVDAGAVDDLRTEVSAALEGAHGSGVDELLPLDGVSTVSLFAHDDGERPALVWYVEHAVGGRWRDPAAVVREQSPLFPALAEYLADGDPNVVADASADVVRLVHESLPGRPNAYADQTGTLPTVLSAGGDEEIPAVVPLRLAVEPGLGTALARLFAGLMDRLADDGVVKRTFESWTEPILEAEGMYTESLLLERTEAGYDLWWYMESGGMEQVYEAYYDSTSRIARLSERALGRVLERPERVLAHPVEASDFELLTHAVAAERE